jgi:hypothetical protein
LKFNRLPSLLFPGNGSFSERISLKEPRNLKVTRQGKKQEITAISDLIAERLKSRALVESSALISSAHLDEDTISAFVEARLGTAESSPVVSHLITCGICRRATAQLIRLESQVADEPDSVPDPATPDKSPSRMHLFFEDLASRLLPSSEEDVVFAYQEDPDRPAASGAESTQTESALEPDNKAEEPQSNK